MNDQPAPTAELDEFRQKLEVLEREVERLRQSLAEAGRTAVRQDEAQVAEKLGHAARLAASAARTAAAEVDARAAWRRAAELGASLARRIAEGQARLIASQAAVASLERANVGLAAGRAAVALREADLRAVIESAIDCAIVTTDRDGLVLAWNSGARRLLGWNEASALTMDITALLPPEERERGTLGTDVEAALSGTRVSREGWLLRQDGSRIWTGIEAMALQADGEDVPVGVLWMLRDRTAAHLAEQRLRRILEIDAVGVLFFRPDGTLVDANDAFLRLSGYTREDLASGALTWRRITPPEWVAESERQMSLLAATGRIGPYEKEYLLKDGSRRWMLFAGCDLGDGTIAKFYIDLTERRRAEAALREREARLRGVLDGMTEGFGLLAPDFTILEHSLEALRMDGRPREQIVGRSHWEAYPGTKDSELGRALEHAMTARVPVSLEHCYAFENGRSLWLDMRAYPTSDGALAVFWRDVTERKAAEAALQEKEQKYRTLFEAMDDGYCVIEMLFDAEGRPEDYRFVEVNAAFERHTGLRDARGRRVREFVPEHDDHWFETYGRIARTGVPERFMQHAEALARWYDVYAFRIGPPELQRVAVLFKDITARKRTEDALRKSEARQAYLLKLTDALRPLSDPAQIREAACRVLGEHLGTDRVHVSEIDVARGVISNARDVFRGGLPSHGGEYDLALYPVQAEAWRAGRSLAIDDVAADATLSEGERAGMLTWAVRAAMTTPMMKGEVPVAVMSALSGVPRRWTADDVALLEETADRGWAAIERASAETLLRESEQRFRGFAENSADVLWIADAGGRRLLYLSPAYDTVFGAPRGDALADIAAVRALVHPDDRATFDAAMPRTLAGETMRVAYRVVRPRDGRVVHLQDTGFPVRGPDGAICQLAGIAQDVTEQRRMEADLAERERQLRALVEGVPHLVWRASAIGLWEWASPQWSAYTGLPEAASRDRGWLEVVHPDDRDPLLATWRATGDAGPFQADCRLRRAADGAWRWFRCRGVPMAAAGRGPDRPTEWLGTATDVDDQIRAREELERSRETLEVRVAERTAELMAAEETLRQAQKLEAIGQLTGGIAHDFNNMLQGVAGALDMARRRIEAGRLEDTVRYLDAARDATGRAGGLTRRLLAFARQQRLEPRQVEPNALVRGMVEMLRRTIGPAIVLDLELEDGCGFVTCDANELESALLNLCINARDAMPEGGRLVISTRGRRLSAADLSGPFETTPGPFVEIAVADTGVGMTAEVLERALEPFFTTKPLGRGTGLGLSQVYGFIQQSGGALRIESSPDRGATVRLWLPFSAQHEVAAEAPADTAAAVGDGGGATLLFVDDETGVREPAVARLRDIGYAVVEAPDGQTALRLLQEGLRPDLLVTDVGLPGGMDGARVAEVAQRLLPGLPVLFVTGYATASLPLDAEVIGKPFTLDALIARVRSAMAARG